MGHSITYWLTPPNTNYMPGLDTRASRNAEITHYKADSISYPAIEGTEKIYMHPGNLKG